MTVVALRNIALDDRGVAYIEGTRAAVSMIVMAQKNGLSPEQIHHSYPHLSLAQIHAALSYYYDHQADIDNEIAEGSAYAAKMRAESLAAGTQPTRAALERRLHERGEGR